ncbi:MAG: PQQ-binding-like beta-propeller repeat protein, partial [Gammaproteobacteria bacterium]|nr:PQQ-binding-like beta-propeller repeat protein [Gammaproteobacteria bacterium]
MRILACLLAVIVTVASPVFAQDAATPDGEKIYKGACAHCHDRSLPRMPSLAELKKKDPRDIFSTISAGLMAPYTRKLTHAERRAVTEYASGQSLGDFASGAAAIPKSAFCANKPDKPIQHIDSGWNGWGNDLENTRFQSAERAGLTAADVPKLKMKWAFGVPAVSTMSGHPIVADGRLFFGTFSGLVIALNAKSGCALWVFEAHAGVRTALTLGKLADGTVSLFFGDLSGKVYAIDPETGKERWNIIADPHPHVRITGTPVYYGNRLYVPISSLEEVAGAMPDYECCTFRGGIMALDAATGKSIWKRHTIAET